jgi:hypothetical protein
MQKQADTLIYKDRKGNEIVMEEFYEDLQHFIDINETMLIKDSAENFETIKKLRKYHVDKSKCLNN